MVSVANTIANDGRVMKPNLVSKIETQNLPILLLDRIVDKKKGIGSSIEILRIETFRHIKNIGFDRRRKAIYRIYDIYIRKQLAITIKEYFPIDLPLWNS
jgi:hypothetical protein